MTDFSGLMGINGIIVTSGVKPYVYQTGVVRWNGNTQQLEVMGQNNDWHPLCNSTATIEFDTDAKILMGWIRQRIIEEQKIKEFCEQHPGLKDVKEKYDIMLALVRQENADK